MIGPWAQRSTNFGIDGARLPLTVYCAIAAILLILIRLFALDIAYVEGQSMTPGLEPGRVVFINKLAYGIRRPLTYGYLVRWSDPRVGDVISVRHPGTGDVLIKRATAVEGMPLALDGSILRFRDDSEVAVFGAARRYFGTISELPERMVLVLGDNPVHSVDSRHFGPVSVELVGGRVAGSAHER